MFAITFQCVADDSRAALGSAGVKRWRQNRLTHGVPSKADKASYSAPIAAFATAMAMKYGLAAKGAGNPFVMTATAMSSSDR